MTAEFILLENHWAKIIEAIGEDLSRPGLVDTPKRAAKAFTFMTQGYGLSVEEVVNDALFPSSSSEMILVQDIELYSLCEHHLLPFIGKCHVAYIPTGKVLGLSKIARIVDVFARRLQIQESLTAQIAASTRHAKSFWPCCRCEAIIVAKCLPGYGAINSHSTCRYWRLVVRSALYTSSRASESPCSANTR